jgi:hypothetical protein
MRDTNGVVEVSEEYSGHEVRATAEVSSLVAKLEKLNVEFNNAHFAQYKADLTFKSLRSLNLAFERI